VLTATSGLCRLRTHYEGDSRDLLRIVVNAVSVVEADLALKVLADDVPEKTLVTACNLREILAAIPSSPFTMRVDEETLARVAGMDRHVATMAKVLDDGLELVITTAGNLVLDLIVRRGDQKWFWNPIPVTSDYVNGDVLDLIVESDCLLDAVLDLARSMGLVLNPKFYVSLEDWHYEYAMEAFEDLKLMF